jgi:hypothetical protein
LGCVPMTPSQVKETWFSLLDKLDGMCSKFQGFLNQVRLIIQLHPIIIQITQLRLALLTHCYQTQLWHGLHLC